MIVKKKGYARAGLVGNPSDGYHGKTIAFTFGNYFAEVILYESPEIEFRPAPQDVATFTSLPELVENVAKNGYYGGIRLMKASVKKFMDYCLSNSVELPDRNFTMRYSSNIPRQLGLGGSSAIITAAMEALLEFYGIEISEYILPNIVLSAETEELGLTAGLQDRVAQAYRGLVYMDFDQTYMKNNGFGRYQKLNGCKIPKLYVAFREDLSQESTDAHLRVRERYELGDRKVIETMNIIASLADEARSALQNGDAGKIKDIIDRNFDLRAEIYEISKNNMDLIKRARSTGASCKFCGSGGSVVGTYEDENMLEALKETMQQGRYTLITPQIVE